MRTTGGEIIGGIATGMITIREGIIVATRRADPINLVIKIREEGQKRRGVKGRQQLINAGITVEGREGLPNHLQGHLRDPKTDGLTGF